MTDREAVSIVHGGGQLECTAEEYPPVRTALLVYRQQRLNCRQLYFAAAAESTIKRLDTQLAFNPKWRADKE